MTLKKGVDHANEVRRAEDDLTKALLMLAAGVALRWWTIHDNRRLCEVVYSPRFESNAAEVERRLLEKYGVALAACRS